MNIRVLAFAFGASLLAACGADDDDGAAPSGAGGIDSEQSGSGGHAAAGSLSQLAGSAGRSNGGGAAGRIGGGTAGVTSAAEGGASGDDARSGEGGATNGADGGSTSDGGRASSGGRAGTSGAGGALDTGGEADSGGAAAYGGAAADGGAGGAPAEELTDGAARFDLDVTVGVHTIPVKCKRVTDAAVRGTYPDAQHRIGVLSCTPPDGSDPAIGVTITFYDGSLGTHAAADLGSTCGDTYCDGNGDVEVTFKSGTLDETVTTSPTSSRPASFTTGTFTLDEFTPDGAASGSLDLTLQNSDYFELTIEGSFAALLHDCGSADALDSCH